MMKHLITVGVIFIALLCSITQASACSFVPYSYCQVLDTFPQELVISATVSDVDSDGINVEVIQVLRGDESRTNLRIWDGTDFDCNGWHSMAADQIGGVNDTVILVLPMIDSLINTWDVLGDYRMPFFWSYSKILRVHDGNINGYLQGDYTMPEEGTVYDYPYALFIEEWNQGNDCQTIFSNTGEVVESMKLQVFPNPVEETLTINTESNSEITQYLIIDAYGRTRLEDRFYSNSARIDISHLPSGMYVLSLLTESKARISRKFLKI